VAFVVNSLQNNRSRGSCTGNYYNKETKIVDKCPSIKPKVPPNNFLGKWVKFGIKGPPRVQHFDVATLKVLKKLPFITLQVSDLIYILK